MRKSILLLFLVGIIGSPMLIPAILKIQTVMLKEAARERAETGLQETIFLREADLQWSDPGSEMTINGEMFDVKEISKTTNGLLVTGVFDTKETAIQKELDMAGAGENGKQTDMLLEYFRLINNIYFRQQEQLPKFLLPSRAEYFTGYSPARIFGFSEIPLPPPKVQPCFS